MDATDVLAVADEVESAWNAAALEFSRKDGGDPIGAAYAAGSLDALDGEWPRRLREACAGSAGRPTCRMETTEKKPGLAQYACSECGERCVSHDTPRFCQSCGARNEGRL